MARRSSRDPDEAARTVMHGETFQSKLLVPAKAATFQGSFAADQRAQEPVTVSAEPGLRRQTWAYFTAGWTVAEIWRSAVCVPIGFGQDQRASFYQFIKAFSVANAACGIVH